MSSPVYDIAGIGIGPFNLGLAALVAPLEATSSIFFDARESFDWHPGMMLEGAHMQTPFMSDLVTLADPTSQYSFLNFAKQTGRLYPFYIRENFFVLRKEYNQYCQWVSQRLPNLRFNFLVHDVFHESSEDLYRIEGINPKTGETQCYYARHVVLGTGVQPWMPLGARESARVHHSASYLNSRQDLHACDNITIVGSGQSAAEIFYDLLCDIHHHDYRLQWITRSPRFVPLEYTKLTLEMTSPEYIDYFFSLPAETRKPLIQSQFNLYKGINSELINDIHDLLYQKRLEGPLNVDLLTNCQLESITEKGDDVGLKFSHLESGKSFSLKTQQMILATGYRYKRPGFIKSLGSELNLDRNQLPISARNYSIDKRERVFIQNYGLETHSLTIPDLGMGCYRNSVIIASILGYEPYRIEESIAFQQFGLPANARIEHEQPAHEDA